MSALYLITGFLGAGKTTFLKQFIPLFRGKNLRLIINEFGREDIDGALLADMGATLQSVVGGSILCACRVEEFICALEQALEEAPDAVLVEASGLTDPTAIRRVLRERAGLAAYDYRGCICLADARTLGRLYDTAQIIQKQLSVSDVAILNKTDAATQDEIACARGVLERHLPKSAILTTSQGAIPPEWAGRLTGLCCAAREDGLLTADIALHQLTVAISPDMPPQRLAYFLSAFAQDTYRIKGFVRLQGQVYLADCVGNDVRLIPSPGQQASGRLTVLYGYGLPARQSIRRAAADYPGDILSIE
nr:GTP-binding protein [bacterium]